MVGSGPSGEAPWQGRPRAETIGRRHRLQPRRATTTDPYAESRVHRAPATCTRYLYNCVVGRCARGVLKKLLTVTGHQQQQRHNAAQWPTPRKSRLCLPARVITRKSLKVLIFCMHSSVATQDILDLVHPPVTRRSCRSRRRQRGHIAQAAHPPSRRSAPARARHRGRFAVLLILVLKVFRPLGALDLSLRESSNLFDLADSMHAFKIDQVIRRRSKL